MVLPHSFYLREDVVLISKELLGKYLFTNIDNRLTGGIIVETEAYRAPDDRACHAYNNLLTNRTKTMFLKGGVVYIYLSYGLHQMINVVTSIEGQAHAVLIRAIQPTIGHETMLYRRNQKILSHRLTNGPGKTGQALGVDAKQDGQSLLNSAAGIWIEDKEEIVLEDNIVTGSRVGMSIHTGKDAHRPWRFYIRHNPWVSRPLQVSYPYIPKK